MNDSEFVCGFESPRDLFGDRQCFVKRNGTMSDSLRERGALNQFKDERVDAVRVFKAVDRCDVRIVQRRQELRFALEAGEPVGIGGEKLREKLERDDPVKLRIGGAIYLAHTARPNPVEDFVNAEANAGRRRHGGAIIRAGSAAYMLPLRRETLMRLRLSSLAILASGAVLAAQTTASRQVEWPFVGGDAGNSKYSQLADINVDNVQRLRIAWQWQHGEGPRGDYNTVPGNFETTPLMVDGVLYVTTPYNNVAAVDATTGRELWRFDGEAYKLGQIPGTGFKHRGAAVWRDGSRLRVFLNSRTKLFSLDAKTGKPVASFGTNGVVSLTKGFPKKISEDQISQGSPPVVYKNLVIVAHAVPDRYQLKNDPPGIVQAFDARTGKLMWVFNIIPQAPDDFGADTWGNESWRFTGHGNVWAPMTVDAARGLLYLPTSTPSSDFYGGRRPGANLLAESLVCVDAATGARKWYFQMVHHGLWDYDNPSAPNLATITVNGKRIDAVIQVTKQGFAYVFDRVTGMPVWPIEERPVPDRLGCAW